jgi:hypothetical protein
MGIYTASKWSQGPTAFHFCMPESVDKGRLGAVHDLPTPFQAARVPIKHATRELPTLCPGNRRTAGGIDRPLYNACCNLYDSRRKIYIETDCYGAGRHHFIVRGAQIDSSVTIALCSWGCTLQV